MGTRLLVAVGIVCLAFTIAIGTVSCLRSSNPPKVIRSGDASSPPKAMGRSGDVVYPDGWPKAELYAPPGSTRAMIPLEDQNLYTGCASISEFEGGKRYEVGFYTLLSSEKVIDHFNTIIKPMGYHYTHTGTPEELWERWSYYSPDNKYAILVQKYRSFDSWYLTFYEYETAQLKYYADALPIP